MGIKTIEWKNNRVKLVDQTRLPKELQYVYISDVASMSKAIKTMQVRGAPALAAAAALGVYLGVKNSKAKNFRAFKKDVDTAISYIGSSRPTARNLFWALERIRRVVLANKKTTVPKMKKIILEESKKIMRQDMRSCRAIGRFGAKLFRHNERVLTLCNTGALATIDYGTGLGVLFRAREKGRRVKVFVSETRPMLQGARLTTWELKRKGFDVTLICDSMAATLMAQGKIDKVIVGADRIAANGDVANKIGTYNLSVLSRYHGVPFYVAAPISTFDLGIKSGKGISIEQRSAEEVTTLFFKHPTACRGIKVFNPAFDVTPHKLIRAIITDKGIIRPPYKKNIKKVVPRVTE